MKCLIRWFAHINAEFPQYQTDSWWLVCIVQKRCYKEAVSAGFNMVMIMFRLVWYSNDWSSLNFFLFSQIFTSSLTTVNSKSKIKPQVLGGTWETEPFRSESRAHSMSEPHGFGQVWDGALLKSLCSPMALNKLLWWWWIVALHLCFFDNLPEHLAN